MEQPLVHPQILGSLVGLLAILWLGMNKGWLPTFKPLTGDLFRLELCSISALLVGSHGPFFAWACSLLWGPFLVGLGCLLR